MRSRTRTRRPARARLIGQDGLLPVARLPDALDATSPGYLLTSTWRLERLQRLSPVRLEPVYTERREVLLRPVS